MAKLFISRVIPPSLYSPVSKVSGQPAACKVTLSQYLETSEQPFQITQSLSDNI